MESVLYHLSFADHYTLILNIENLPMSQKKEEKEVRWNLEKPGGWEEYERLSHSRSSKLDKVTENRNKNIQEIKSDFDRIHNKILFQAFGKVTLKQKRFNCEEKMKHKYVPDEGEKWSNDENMPEGRRTSGMKQYEEWQEDDFLLDCWLFNDEEGQDGNENEGEQEDGILPEVTLNNIDTQKIVDDDEVWQEDDYLLEGWMFNDEEWQVDVELPEGWMERNESVDENEWKLHRNIPEGWMDDETEAARLLDKRNEKIEKEIQNLRESKQGSRICLENFSTTQGLKERSRGRGSQRS